MNNDEMKMSKQALLYKYSGHLPKPVLEMLKRREAPEVALAPAQVPAQAEEPKRKPFQKKTEPQAGTGE